MDFSDKEAPMNKTLFTIALMALCLSLAGSSVASAACFVCTKMAPPATCWVCANDGEYVACILGTPCVGNGYSTCGNWNPNCTAAAPEEPDVMMFSERLLTDLRQVHPQLADMLQWVNDNGGVMGRSGSVHSADLQSETEVQYDFTMREKDGRPYILEVTATKPYPNDPTPSTFLFNVPDQSSAAATAMADSWMDL